jgi:hypothetical protein
MDSIVQQGRCSKGIYSDNSVVFFSRPILCFGYKPIDQPVCEYLDRCLEEHGLFRDKAGRIRRRKQGQKVERRSKA